MKTHQIKPIPDWHITHFFFVWPASIPNRKKIIPLLLDICKEIPVSSTITIIIKNQKDECKIRQLFEENFLFRKIEIITLPSLMDIWIRDWAPLPVIVKKGRKSLVKTIYMPSYIKHDKYARGDDNAGWELATHLGLPMQEIPLRWDGGNFTYNGARTAIVTRKILHDNPGMNEEAIGKILKTKLGIDHLIFIDPEPGDPTGHVDGTVRFLSESILAVAEYPSKFKKENEWLVNLVNLLIKELDDDIEIIRIPNGKIEKLQREGIPSAYGNHVNFLRVGNTVLLPCYGCKEDEKAMRAIEDACKGIIVRPIKSESSIELSRLGGVFNCISWGV